MPRTTLGLALHGLALIGVLAVFMFNMNSRIASIEAISTASAQRTDQQQGELTEINTRLREIEAKSIETAAIAASVLEALTRIEKGLEK